MGKLLIKEVSLMERLISCNLTQQFSQTPCPANELVTYKLTSEKGYFRLLFQCANGSEKPGMNMWKLPDGNALIGIRSEQPKQNWMYLFIEVDSET